MITALTSERRAAAINGLHPGDPGLYSLFNLGAESASGELVSPTTALRQEAFLSGVRYLAETIASVPLFVLERLEPRGRRRAVDHRLYARLHDQPNRFQTSFEWRDMMMHHLILRGNSYNRIASDGRLLPLHPDRVTPFWAPNGQRAYEYRPPQGAPATLADRIILQSEMFHVSFLPDDGLKGRSLLEYQRDTIGRALAANKFAASFLRNGGRPGGVLKTKKKLSKDAKDSLREQWTARFEGSINAGRTAILEEDMDWAAVNVSNEDSQLMEMMQFDVESMARILRIPPHKIGGLQRATFSNIEHQSIEAVQDSIRPWCVRIEQAAKRDLFTEAEQRRFYVQHNLDGLLRGDFQTRMQGYATGRQWGWFSANDIREREDENPIEDGDIYMVPLNMVPANQAAQMLGEGRTDRGTERCSLEMIARLRAAHLPIIEDAVRRLLRRETDNVERQFRRQAQERSLADFMAWADGWYAEFRAIIAQTMAPGLAALASTVSVEAAETVGAGSDADGLDEFVSSYVAAMAARHVGESRAALLALASMTDAAAMLEAAAALFRAWRNERAATEARGEAVRVSNAVARFVWQAAGVEQVSWRRAAECSDCDALDGKTVGIREAFVEGLLHPPAHAGCQCSLVPA